MRLRALPSLVLGLAICLTSVARADIVVGQSVPLTGEAVPNADGRCGKNTGQSGGRCL